MKQVSSFQSEISVFYTSLYYQTICILQVWFLGKYRYLSLAQDLVMSARGKLKDRNWKRANGSPATIDDISVFVIPILPYKEEYRRSQVGQTTLSRSC